MWEIRTQQEELQGRSRRELLPAQECIPSQQDHQKGKYITLTQISSLSCFSVSKLLIVIVLVLAGNQGPSHARRFHHYATEKIYTCVQPDTQEPDKTHYIFNQIMKNNNKQYQQNTTLHLYQHNVLHLYQQNSRKPIQAERNKLGFFIFFTFFLRK